MAEETEPTEEQDEQTQDETVEAPVQAVPDAVVPEPESDESSDPAVEVSVEPAAAKPSVAAASEIEEPANALSRPPTIDLEALLTPISADAPSGEYLRYEGIYDEIGEERRADEDLAQGAWQSELKNADFKRVIELATAALTTRTKDLQLTAWLSEAVVSEHGFAGLRDSLRLVRGLIKGFWESVYPEIDEGNEEGRANAIAWFDRKAGFLIRKAPILETEGASYLGYMDSKKFDIPDNLDSLETEERQAILALREIAERENRMTGAKWAQAVSLTKRAFCEELKVAVDECSAELKKLNLAIEDRFDRNQAPGLRGMGKALTDIEVISTKILERKRIEEPDPSDAVAGEEGEVGESEKGSGSKSGAVSSRDDALRKLSEIAAFFRRTEPHSPVAYLVNRAVNWGNMPLENWLQDVIKDETILHQLRQTLGFNTTPSGESKTVDE